MKLGELIKRRREILKLSRADLSTRLEDRGIHFPQSTLRNWETGVRQSENDWNPNFLEALAEVLEMDVLEMLDELGFPVIPPGLTVDNLMLIQKLRELPEEKRRRAIRMLITIIDEL
jgi:transcriptional regulator with XRE-family HTH domain